MLFTKVSVGNYGCGQKVAWPIWGLQTSYISTFVFGYFNTKENKWFIWKKSIWFLVKNKLYSYEFNPVIISTIFIYTINSLNTNHSLLLMLCSHNKRRFFQMMDYHFSLSSDRSRWPTDLTNTNCSCPFNRYLILVYMFAAQISLRVRLFLLLWQLQKHTNENSSAEFK